MRIKRAGVFGAFLLGMLVYFFRYIEQHTGPLKIRDTAHDAAQNIDSNKTSDNSVRVRQNETEIHLPFLKFKSADKEIKELINANCVDNFTVPPLLHYIWLSKKMMLYHEYVGMLSAHLFIKPCYILLHGDTIPGGKWWDLLLTTVKNILFVRRKAPAKIFGKAVKFIEHKADLMRLEILLEYGGIYSDTDMYFLRSFDPLRNYTTTVSRETPKAIANGIILSNKNSPLLRIYYLSYHTFSEKHWGESSVIMLHKLWEIFPQLFHLQPGMVRLGTGMRDVINQNSSWAKSQYSVHLYSRFMKNRQTLEIEHVKKLNTTFGALTRLILFGKTDFINK